MLGVKAFAGEPPLHVDNTDKHSIDCACHGFRFQILKREMSCHGHFVPPVVSSIGQMNRLAGQNHDASHFRPEQRDSVGCADALIHSCEPDHLHRRAKDIGYLSVRKNRIGRRPHHQQDKTGRVRLSCQTEGSDPPESCMRQPMSHHSLSQAIRCRMCSQEV